jgi:hypothetical protein
MGFFDRIFGKKTTTNSTSTSTATNTPTNPEWVTSGVRGLSDRTLDLLGRDPKSFVAGPSALQKKAFRGAGNLSLSPMYGQAGDIFSRVAGSGANTYDAAQGRAQDWTSQGYDPTTGDAVHYKAASLLENLDKYMSPYTGQVVDTALADYDFGAGQTRSTQALDEARSGAFGGSGAAITRALTEDALTRGRGTLSAGLRDEAFGRGAGLAATDTGWRNEARANAAAAQNAMRMANMDAQNRAAQFRAEAANQAAMQNAAAGNQFGLANMSALNDAGRFNASARDTALARQLQAGGALAGLGTSMGADTRANVALQAQLGGDQRAIDQALSAADINVLNDLAGIYGNLPLNLFTGNTTTGTQTGSGVTKTFDPWGTITNLVSAARKG